MSAAYATDVDSAVARTPRWAVIAAYMVPLCLLPSSVWRIELVATSNLANGW